MANKRDNFSPKTIERLRSRVNGICSKPNCNISCVAPKENDPAGLKIVGIAAHICAASEGGPRFEKSMTRQNRKSISNGIWLCQIHAKEIDIIDNGEYKYKKEELLLWKKQAEDKTRKYLGEKTPSENDASNLLKSALTGVSAYFSANAIHNVFKASDSALEELDSRFSVASTYDGKAITTEFKAKEPVEISLHVRSDFYAEYSRKMTDLTHHGKDLEIDATGITFQGSKLLEETLNGSGTFTVSKQKKKIKQKIWVVDPKTKIIEQFDDLDGELVAGTKTFTVVAHNCDGIIKTTLIGDLNLNNKLKMSINLNSNQWEGVDIRELPYFDKIYKLYQKINKGWLIGTSIEIEGNQILETNTIRMTESKFFCPIMTFLRYTHFCRTIVNKFDHSIYYKNNISFTVEDFNNIRQTANIIEGKITYNNKNITSSFIAKVDVTLGKEVSIKDIEEFKTIRIEEPEDDIKLFETTISLPIKTSYFSNFKTEITNRKTHYTDGDKLEVVLKPSKRLHGLVTYNYE